MESRVNLTKMLVSIFVDGNSSSGVHVRTAAGEALMFLFFSKRSITTVLSREVADFFGGLLKIVSQVGKNDAGRISAIKLLERVRVVYTENGECLGTFRDGMTNVMPMVRNSFFLDFLHHIYAMNP